jgi:hypothetical protein
MRSYWHYRRLSSGLLALAVFLGHAAEAQDAVCATDLEDVQVRGNLNVTSRCRLTDADVRGDVILFAGGSLIARSARIRGNVEGNRADFVDLDDVRVDGNVSLRELVGDSSRIESSEIRGDVVLASNRSRFEILNNELRGNLRAFGNSGGLRIAGNAIDDNLECSGNTPAPTGLGNRVDGDAEAQCENLRPQPAASPPPPAPRPPAASPPPAARPPAAPAPAAPPQPTTPPPPAAPPAPPPTPPPAAPPPAPAPPAAATPPAETPPAASPPPTDTLPLEDGGAGAIGWPIILLLPFVAWRSFRRRPNHDCGAGRASPRCAAAIARTVSMVSASSGRLSGR